MISELASDRLFGLALTAVFVTVLILNALSYWTALGRQLHAEKRTCYVGQDTHVEVATLYCGHCRFNCGCAQHRSIGGNNVRSSVGYKHGKRDNLSSGRRSSAQKRQVANQASWAKLYQQWIRTQHSKSKNQNLL